MMSLNSHRSEMDPCRAGEVLFRQLYILCDMESCEGQL
jgi:hypothetical protein